MPQTTNVTQTVEPAAPQSRVTDTAQENTSSLEHAQFQARMRGMNIPPNGSPASINHVVQRIAAGGQHPLQKHEDFMYLQRTIGNQAVIQLLDRMKTAETEGIHKTAAAGVQGTGSQLPHLDKIQQSFGQHDVSGVKSFTGTKATTASKAIGAEAYTTGNKIAFSSSSPDLHTTAHEVTHVLQQAAGVHLQGGVGEVGDKYERQADAVADKVVKGQSADGLIGVASVTSANIQMANSRDTKTKQRRETDPNFRHVPIESCQPRLQTKNIQAKEFLQAVWNSQQALNEISNSKSKTVAELVITNLTWQEEALTNRQAMQKSMTFSAVGYEFEFAQLPREDRNSEFGRKSHLELARGGYRFPLFPSIPFMVETDMSSVIELAMPPLLIPRNSRTHDIDERWVSTVLLKIEIGLKSLARNSTMDLASLLNAVGFYLGLGANYFDISSIPGEDPHITKAKKVAKYGLIEKNSRVSGKFTTAQANMITTLAQAIKMSFDQAKLPLEIEKMQDLFKRYLQGPNADVNNYITFIAQKMTEIPYMFLDDIHSISLREYERNPDGAGVSSFISSLTGHESNKRPENRVRARREDEDPKKHTVRSVVSKVKNRGAGWIKSTLAAQVRLFPPPLISAVKQTTDTEIMDALGHSIAYKAILRYAEIESTGNWLNDYLRFETQAIRTMRDVLNGIPAAHQADQNPKAIKEQKDDGKRELISTARPDTVVDITQNVVAYDIGAADAVLVESRKPTETFDIPFSARTTNKSASDVAALKRMARQQLNLFDDPNWYHAFVAANPDNRDWIEHEIAILEQLIYADKERDYFLAWHNINDLPMKGSVFWLRIIAGLRTLGFLAEYRFGEQRKKGRNDKLKTVKFKHFMKPTFSSTRKQSSK